MKKKIQFDIEEDFSMIGIASPKPVFQLAFLLNQQLQIQLTKFQDLQVLLGLNDFPDTFSYSDQNLDYYLFFNKQPPQTQKSIKSKKTIDYPYFFILHPSLPEEKLKEFHQKIRFIPEITISSIIENRKEVINMLNLII